MDTVTGLLHGAAQIPSPNADDRPDASDINLLIVHSISLPPGEFGGPYIDQLFTNTLDPRAHPYFAQISDSKVSSHLLIRRDGQVTQYVPFHRRAWHAGQSCFGERDQCNDFSIGIELEGTDEVPYEDVQYACLGGIVSALMAVYPAITPQRVVGHCDVAPGRKTDPGPVFDWARLQREVEMLA